MSVFLPIVVFFLVVATLFYRSVSLNIGIIVSTVTLMVLSILLGFSWLVWLLYVSIAIVLTVPIVRCVVFASWLKPLLRGFMPRMSNTEKEALMAGTVGWEGELFTGKPNWSSLSTPAPGLTDKEMSFIAGPVDALCAMINDWEISSTRVIPEEIWTMLRAGGFFGLIIPESYGGKGFSARAHAAIIAKIASVSTSVATVVCVPNSLGPAELLLHYGTELQKNYFLPRLASGTELPCFALTSPVAGSDAGSMVDYGVVCEAELAGERQLCIRLNWSKRYITLSPVATILGLAFKMFDPDGLLGDQVSLGITCALIPVSTPGVVCGRRHNPLGSAFPNGPTEGKDVLVSLDAVIGGRAQIGCGWRMLMACLSAGRAVSLPSLSGGCAQRALYATGTYVMARTQFKVPLMQFEGIQAPLAQMVGYGFMSMALRWFAVSRVDMGQTSAVASAIAKLNCTQWSREMITAAMDIHGGKGICMGPHNYLAQMHIESPISITVEGANILTRSLMIFGQGVMRCHPCVLPLLQSVMSDESSSVAQFDRAFFALVGHMLSTGVRSVVFGLTAGRGSEASGKWCRYQRAVNHFSSVLAFISDVSMAQLGGQLKRKERLSQRLADVLSGLYTATAILQWVEQYQPLDEFDGVVHWSLQKTLHDVEHAFSEFTRNYPVKWTGRALRVMLSLYRCRWSLPSDKLDSHVVTSFCYNRAVRDLLTADCYTMPTSYNSVGIVDEVWEMVVKTMPLEKKFQAVMKKAQLSGYDYCQQVDSAVSQGLMTPAEGRQLQACFELKMRLIHVDDFSNVDFSDPVLPNAADAYVDTAAQ